MGRIKHMTLQPHSNNPIAVRKQKVRKHSKNLVISVAGGLAGGVFLGWALTGFWTWMTLGLIVAVVGGVYNWIQINKIINHQDQY